MSLLSSQLNVLLFLELLGFLLSLFAFFFVFLDGEQIVVGLVAEEDSDTFKAEVARQDFAAVHDEVRVAALGADDAGS